MNKRHDYNYCSNYSEKDETQHKALRNYRRECCERQFFTKGSRKLQKYLANRGYELKSFVVFSKRTNKIYTLEDFING